MQTYKITKQFSFCYGHRLMNYEGKDRILHGHNAILEVDIEANQLDINGMVIDIHQLKVKVQEWIDNTLDHKMILSHQDPLTELLKKIHEPFLCIETNPTSENIAKLIFDGIGKMGFPISEVRLWETPTIFVSYKKN